MKDLPYSLFLSRTSFISALSLSYITMFRLGPNLRKNGSPAAQLPKCAPIVTIPVLLRKASDTGSDPSNSNLNLSSNPEEMATLSIMDWPKAK